MIADTRSACAKLSSAVASRLTTDIPSLMATDCSYPLLDSIGKQCFRRRLMAWYAKHERDLPWRKTQDPYRIWVSEIMLQQTQVETVKPYFLRFLKAFPTVKKLATANESQVLRLWEGLGYYRRARGLHAAAKLIVAKHEGNVPSDVASLMSLPGIGRYTAGAIASIAFGQRAPILEANTIRLLARLLAYPNDPTKASGQRLLWATAEEILPKANVARFNQALMELGSLVCTPTQPKCDQCPVSRNCGAFKAGLQNRLPRNSAKMKFTDVREAAVVVRKNGQLIVRQCGQNERWAGLWDFPRFEIESEGPLFVEKELIEKVRHQTGVSIEPADHITTIKHGVTRYRITLDCYIAKYVSGRLKRNMQWIRPTQLTELPLSTTGRSLANRIARKDID